MLEVRTPLGRVVHTADFKLAPNPSGESVDLERLARMGRDGVLALLSDSTNADRPGVTPGESSVEDGIESLVEGAGGRVVVTTFASHIQRIQMLGRIAARHGRSLALIGAALERHADLAEELGMLPLPPGSRIPADAIMKLPPGRVLVVASGSQGEPMSSMARIALGQHRHVELEPGDLVIHSAREIPGNEKSIARMTNHLLRRGARVVSGSDAAVHVSGHAARDELREVLELLRPRFVVPIHGEYRQLAAHADLAVESGVDRVRVQIADSGDVIAVSREGISVVDRVHVGQVFLDATLDEVELAVLRDRRRLAEDGIVVPVVAVHRESGTADGYPEIMSCGFVPIQGDNDAPLLDEIRGVVATSVADASAEERADEALLRTRIQSELKRFLRRRTNRRPLVIPVILEI
jgi:ribonuclease J